MYNSKGSIDNKEEVLNASVHLVKKIAFQIKSRLPPSVEMDDLIQAGMIGLMDAVNRFEDNHGAQFETYASQRIRGAILDELRNSDYLPRSLRKNMRDIETVILRLEHRLGQAPTETQIAKEMGISITEYQEVLTNCNGHQIVYYEDFHNSDGGNEHFLDRFSVDDSGDPIRALLSANFRESLVEAITELPDREKTLMSLYYDENMNFKEIGAVLEISESRVCQLHTQAVARLRSSLKERLWTSAAP